MENFFIDTFGSKDNICYYYNIKDNDQYLKVIELLSEIKKFYTFIYMDFDLFDYKIDFIKEEPYINFSILMDFIFPIYEIGEDHRFINEFIMFIIKNKIKTNVNDFYFSADNIKNYIVYLNDKRIVFTYIMKDNNSGLYKIGRSRNPIFREKTLLGQTPNIILEFLIPFNIENRIHKEIKEKRVRGEWFKLNQNELIFILKKYRFYKNINIFKE